MEKYAIVYVTATTTYYYLYILLGALMEKYTIPAAVSAAGTYYYLYILSGGSGLMKKYEVVLGPLDLSTYFLIIENEENTLSPSAPTGGGLIIITFISEHPVSSPRPPLRACAWEPVVLMIPAGQPCILH